MGKLIKIASCPLKGGEQLDFYLMGWTPVIRYLANASTIRWDACIKGSEVIVEERKAYKDGNCYVPSMTLEQFKSKILSKLRPSARTYTPSELLFHQADWIREFVAALDWNKDD